MLDLNDWESDYDIMLVVKNLDQMKSSRLYEKDKKIDLFICDTSLKYHKDLFWKDQHTNKLLWLIGMLQLNFFTSKSILYKSKDFDVDEYINRIKNHKWVYLEEFITDEWISQELRELDWVYFNKDYYHICYISSLIDDSQVDWQKVRNIKKHKISIDEIKYIEYCCQKLLNWYKYKEK